MERLSSVEQPGALDALAVGGAKTAGWTSAFLDVVSRLGNGRFFGLEADFNDVSHALAGCLPCRGDK